MGYPRRRHNHSLMCTPQRHSFSKSNRFRRHENWWATPSELKTHLPAYAKDEAEAPQLSAKISSAEARRAADVQRQRLSEEAAKWPMPKCEGAHPHSRTSFTVIEDLQYLLRSRVGSRVLIQVKLDNSYAKWIGNGTWRSESLIASEIKVPLVSYQDHKKKTSSFSSSALSTYPSKSILALLRAVSFFDGSLFSWTWPPWFSLPRLRLPYTIQVYGFVPFTHYYR